MHVHRALRPAGRAARVRDEQRMLAVDRERVEAIGLPGDELGEREVATRSHRHVGRDRVAARRRRCAPTATCATAASAVSFIGTTLPAPREAVGGDRARPRRRPRAGSRPRRRRSRRRSAGRSRRASRPRTARRPSPAPSGGTGRPRRRRRRRARARPDAMRSVSVRSSAHVSVRTVAFLAFPDDGRRVARRSGRRPSGRRTLIAMLMRAAGEPLARTGCRRDTSSTSVVRLREPQVEEAHDRVPEPFGLVDRPPRRARRTVAMLVRGHEARDVARRAGARRIGSPDDGGAAHRPRNLRRRPGSVQPRCRPSHASDRSSWIDLEMTGLDVEQRRHRRDRVHRHRLRPGRARRRHPARRAPGRRRRSRGWTTSSATCTRKSGLLAEIAAATYDTSRRREQAVLAYVQQHVTDAGLGAAVRQQHRHGPPLPRQYMPELDDYLHYRSIDVSSLKELCRRWYPAIYRKRPGKAEQHRALGDIQESIEELRYYRDRDVRRRRAEAHAADRTEYALSASALSASSPSSAPSERRHRPLPRRVAHQADAPTLAGEVAEPAADLDVEAGAQLAAHLGVVDAVGQPDRRELRQPSLLRERPEAELGQRVLQQRRRRAGAVPTTPRALPRAARRGRRATRRASRSARCGGSGARCRRSRRAARGRGTTTAPGADAAAHALDRARRRS